MSTKTGEKEMWVSALCVSFFLSSCLSFCQRISHRTTTGPPEGRLQDPRMAWRKEKEIDEVVFQDNDLYHSSLCAKFAFFSYVLTYGDSKKHVFYIQNLLDHSHHQNICFHHERDTICSLCVCVFWIFDRNASKKMIPKKLYSNARQSRLILGFFLIGTSSDLL